jgi:hypothetical protein
MINLELYFFSRPTARVTWKLVNPERKHEIEDFGRAIILRNLQWDDVGDYYCIGYNDLGEGVPVTLRLNITGQSTFISVILIYERVFQLLHTRMRV